MSYKLTLAICYEEHHKFIYTTMSFLKITVANSELLVYSAGVAADGPTEEVGGWHEIDPQSARTLTKAKLAVTLQNQKDNTPPLKFEGL